jgi:hypothetical protein
MVARWWAVVETRSQLEWRQERDVTWPNGAGRGTIYQSAHYALLGGWPDGQEGEDPEKAQAAEEGKGEVDLGTASS